MAEQLKPLLLHVKSAYFEQIKRGEKTEEYREYKPYWESRLFSFEEEHGEIVARKRRFSAVVIQNAYKQGKENRLTFPWRGWKTRIITHPHFGKKEVEVFAIQLKGEVKHGLELWEGGGR